MVILSALIITSRSGGTSYVFIPHPTSSPVKSASLFQERAVLKVTSPSDPGYADLKPVCKTQDGCPGIHLPAGGQIIAQGTGDLRYTLGPAIVTTQDVVAADAAPTPDITANTSSWFVSFQLSPRGTSAFKRASALAYRATPRPLVDRASW